MIGEIVNELKLGDSTIQAIKWSQSAIRCDALSLALLCNHKITSSHSLHPLPTPTHACAFDGEAVYTFPISLLHSFIMVHRHKVIVLSDIEGILKRKKRGEMTFTLL
jgi:hypothetical protein